MKRIGIDCRFSSIPTGLGRYTREIVPALTQQKNDVQWILFVRSAHEPWLQTLPSHVRVVVADIVHYSFAEQVRLPRLLYKEHLDLFFALHFNVPLRLTIPSVVVLHDLILHAYPNASSVCKQWIYKLVLRTALRRARAIIAVSAFTQKEAVRYFGAKIQQKITVVPEAVSSTFCPPSASTQERVQHKHNLPQKYFLYVGNAKQHKNVSLLLDAFVKASLEDTELLLVSPGKEAEALLLPSGVRRLKSVTDTDLPVLYTKAQAFVTASLYEGFCLPILEARACYCPVIASNTSAMPELAAPGVQYVQPTVEAFSNAFVHFACPAVVEPSTRTWEDVARESITVLLAK